MAKDITVSVKRNGIVVNPGTALRLDNISPIVIASNAGAIPNYSYEAYTLDGVYDAQDALLIQQGDLLIDIETSEQYRVSGLQEPFDEDHIECMVTKNVQAS